METAMAENNDAKQLEEAKKNAVAELKSLQAEKGWNDEKIKECAEAIEGMSSLKDIEEYLEARRKEEKKENKNEGQESGTPKEEENKEPTPEERKAAREEQMPTDEFKDFIEKQYGEGSFDKHYVHGPDEEKDRFEIQYEAVTKKSPLREPEKVTINEIDPDEIDKPAKVNTDDSHADEPEWKKMRREAWEKYAADNKQEFKLLSEDKAPDLSMSVGDTPIKYADEHNVTMGNGEYGKFLKAVEIEKNAKTDVINFGKIESEEYKAKLAAACIQMGMRMKNGPKSIDLSLDCFKDLDDATKAKIEAYNQKQAEKENNAEKPKEETRDEKPAEENKYKKLFDEKVKEFKDKKEKGESLDFSQIKDPVERMVAYAAAKESKLKIENLSNYEKLVDSKLDDKAKAEVAAARAALPENSQNHLKARETWEQKLVEIKGRLKNKEQKRGQYHDKDGNLVDSKLSVHDQDGKLLQNVERNKVEYKIETQENGQKKKTYERDDAGLFKLRQQQGRGSR